MDQPPARPLILRADGVTRTFLGPDGPIRVLDGADLTVSAGEVLALLGPSGSGKSTLLACCAGLDSPNSGRVVLAGQDLAPLDEAARARLRARSLGFVFQDFRLFADLTAQENVRLPLELAGRADAVAVADRWLDRVGLGQRSQHRPHQLSGGERQRVAVARALVADPVLILADEPTGSLDRRTGGLIADLLLDLARASGAAVVLVTHDAELASRADRRVSMDAGRIVAAP